MADGRTFDLGRALTQRQNLEIGAQNLRNAQLLEERTGQGNILAQQFFAGGGQAGGQDLSALAGVDAPRAAAIQQFTQRQNEFAREQRKQQAEQSFRKAQFVAQSESPLALMKTAFPDDVKRIADEEGVNIDDLEDDDIRQGAQAIMEHFGPIAGLGPEDIAGEEQETFTPVTDESGRIIGQRSSLTGKVVTDPRAPKAGTSFRVNPDTGEIEFQQGIGVTGDLQKSTRGNIEKQIDAIRDESFRLQNIAAGFRPEFQTFGTRFGALKTAFKEKAQIDVTPEEQQALSDFTTFKRDAIENINLGIKRITGAQMSEAEADRIRLGFPDPGEGVFEGDSPTEFKSKLDATTKQLRLVAARKVWTLRNGLGFSALPIGAMEGLISQREDELRATGIGDAEIESQMRREFGL